MTGRRLLAALAVTVSACSGATPVEVTIEAVETTTASVAGSSTTSTRPAEPTSTSTEASPTYEAGATGIGDSLYEALGNGGYDVAHYDLELTFDGTVLSGSATLTATATIPLESFSLDLTGMKVTGVQIEDREAEFAVDDELWIELPDPVDLGQSFKVEIEYSGRPAAIPNVAGRFAVGWHKSVDGWFALSEPAGAETWFPNNNHPLDKATFVLEMTVPVGLVAVSSGTLVSEEDTGEWSTFTWESDEPIAPYLIALAIGDFEEQRTTSPEGVLIRDFFDEEVTEANRRLFDRQGEMLDFFADLFGPYPFDEYGALVLETVQAPAALETQTRSTFGTQILVLGEAVVAHELAHQWFGDSVSVADWSDVWLNEGFATYGQWLWAEHAEGEGALVGHIEDAYQTLRGDRLSGDPQAAYQQALDTYPPPGLPRPDDLFNASVYVRGALTLHALRLEVGDAVFFGFLRDWATSHRFGHVSTGAFIEAVGEIGGGEAVQLMEEWLFSDHLPPLPELGLVPPA